MNDVVASGELLIEKEIEHPVEIGGAACQRALSRLTAQGKQIGAVTLLQHALIVEGRKGQRPDRSVGALDVEIAIDGLRALARGEDAGNALQRRRREQRPGKPEDDELAILRLALEK